MNNIISDICLHIVSVFEKDGTVLDYGEVLNKFENFVTNKTLVTENRDILDRIYNRCISDKKLMEFTVTKLYGSMNEGFYNPFLRDEEQGVLGEDEYILVDNDRKVENEDGAEVDEIKINDDCVNGKIYYKDGKMYSGVNIKRGDVIEICPVVRLDRESMCSRSIRDMAFQLSINKDDYGIPLGYANVYRTNLESKEDGNIDYEYPESSEIIKFVAARDIDPNEELILRVEDE